MIDWNIWAAIIGFSGLGLFVLWVCVWLWWMSGPQDPKL